MAEESDLYAEFRKPPSANDDPYAEFRSEPEKPASTEGFVSRVANGFRTMPRDMVDQFMDGFHATADPSGRILGEGQHAHAELGPVMERIMTDAGISPEVAKAEAARKMRDMERQQVLGNLVMGPLQMIFGPLINAPIRSFVSRPLEETVGVPKEVTETAAMSLIAARGLQKMHRLTLRQDGTIKTDPIGDAPLNRDFENAAKRITDVIEGEFTVVDDGTGLPKPTPKQLTGPAKEQPKPAMGAEFENVAANLRRLWDEDGIHPAEAARDVATDPFLRDQLMRPKPPEPIQPIEAHHGTPHDFEAFDISRIGTGEGAQVFGHGLYFAEDKAVGEHYQRDLSSDPRTKQLMADEALREVGPAKAEQILRQRATSALAEEGIDSVSREFNARNYEEAADLVKGGYKTGPKDGVLYRVNLHVNSDHLLDLDKPLTEQTPHVQDAVKRAFGADYNGNFDAAKSERLWNEHKNALGDTVVKNGFISPDAARTSQLLKEAGIPGSQYLDEGSRGLKNEYAESLADQYFKSADGNYKKAYENLVEDFTDYGDEATGALAILKLEGRGTPGGTRNFVIFDDKLIDITHKNGTEIIRQVDAGNGAPPRSANVSPDGLPRTMYPQAVAAAQGQAVATPPPGGGGQPPTVPPQGGVGPAIPPGAGGSGLPPPPPQGPPLQTTPPQRPPYFTYDDSNAFVKAFNSVISGWQKTFQPDLVSDRALQADPRFAEYKSRSQNLKDQIVHNQEADYQYWRKQSEADRLAYLRGFETGNVPPALRARADVHKQMMQEAHKMEVQAGSQADYFENYFPHLFQSPQQAAVWMKGKTAQVGPTWFQKDRTFATIREAMDAGLRLISTNPEHLITQRLFSTADMLERMDLINDMRGMGLSETVEQARADRAQRINIAQRMGFPIDVTTVGRDLSAEGWEIINAPNRQQWFIAPDVRPLWENAMAAKGLWGNEDAAGNTFRAWMSFKNSWVPIKLALSAFHPLHVAHINMTGHVVDMVSKASRGEYGDAMRSLGDIVYDPIAAAIPGLTHEGRFAREAWLVPEDARTPLQRAVVKTMEEGGMVANISEQLRIDSQRKLEEAFDKQQWFKMAPQLVRETLRRIGAPVFEHWIPNLKVSAYLREASDFLARNPNIANDDVQRGVALRTIGKSVENRYGEMFYGNLFWNRMLKDIGIGSFISLGWNAGFIREFGGAAVGPLARGVRSTYRGPTQTEQTIYHAQSKFAYAFSYMAGAMLISGMITYANTGQDPEGMDWAFPRTGRTNPDGSPHRLTNMFYSRELPMLEKHMQSSGSVVGGVADTLYGKLVVGPIVELARNKDYYGNEIWSEGNPLYKKGSQAAQYLFGNQMMPMSITGAQQAMKTGGGWDEAALAMVGFGPAPSYANKTATQNLVEHLFQKFVAPEARPQEMGVKAKERGDIRSEILMAQQRGDNGAITDASQKWFKAGGSRQGLTNILMHIPPDVSMFRALPEAAQQQVMASAPPEETGKYKPFLKADTAARVADLQMEAMASVRAGDDAGAQRIGGEIQAVLADAVHSGRITNITEFQKSVQQHMMFRMMPQEAAQKMDAPRQRRMMQPAFQ